MVVHVGLGSMQVCMLLFMRWYVCVGISDFMSCGCVTVHNMIRPQFWTDIHVHAKQFSYLSRITMKSTIKKNIYSDLSFFIKSYPPDFKRVSKIRFPTETQLMLKGCHRISAMGKIAIVL